MAGLQTSGNEATHRKLADFLDRWKLETVRKMSLDEYTSVGDRDTFCYWLEFETEELGRIGGHPSNKFGIWRRKNSDKEVYSDKYLFNDDYVWYKKYGSNPSHSFEKVKNEIINIIENSEAGRFNEIDTNPLNSLTRWKIAFLYSNYSLLPIYKKDIIRKIAERFGHPKYKTEAISILHAFILAQKDSSEDFFDFAGKQYSLAKKTFERNYYIIGTKYQDEDGNDTINIMPSLLKRNVVATGYLSGIDFSNLYGRSYEVIHEWADKNIDEEYKKDKFDTAKRAIGYFLNLRAGDLIALKSHGRFGNLTIIAYAEVKEVNGKVYEPDRELGHIIHVDFLETNLWIETGLSYSNTIHHITPGQRPGHFEKIFGSYSALECEPDSDDEDIVDEDRINEKSVDPYERQMRSSQIVNRAHDKLQISFARHLKRMFSDYTVRTEHNYIDIIRYNDDEIFYYEVKPYNSAFACVRAGLGQLLDYCHSNPTQKVLKIFIVGSAEATETDLEFIDFVKNSIKIPFEYISHNPSIDSK